MWILPLIGYLGLALGFCFLTLAIASGLYYLSELVEEHTVTAKKLLTRLIYGVIALQAFLLIDRLPLALSALSMVSHGVYLQNLRFFPIVRLTDPIFVASCILVLVNHYLWFRHFSIPPDPRTTYGARARSIYDPPPDLPSFTEIASFFFIQVWLVPFALFVSLSASENVLPTMGNEIATDPNSDLAQRSRSQVGGLNISGMLTPRSASRDPNARSPSAVRGPADGGLGFSSGRGRRKTGAKGLARVAVDGVREWVSETGEVMGFWKGDRTRQW